MTGVIRTPEGKPLKQLWRYIRNNDLEAWNQSCVRGVGIGEDGELHNPYGYPEDQVRRLIGEANERRAQRRKEGAAKAAVTRKRRQKKRFEEVAKIVQANGGIEGQTHCAICGRHLSDPPSVKRGIGPECWGKLRKTAAPCVRV